MASNRIDYGLDAPKVVRKLALAGAAALMLAWWLPPKLQLGGLTLGLRGIVFVTALICLAEAGLMLSYSRVGKRLYRERLLDWHAWRGDERVLDVGTGRGLLAIGAARRLRSGEAVGIDIWSAEDLSGNGAAPAQANAQAEGVADRVRFENGDITQAPFPDASFDVVLSNLCLHNIYDRAGRDKACAEIARLLKPGGVAIVSDFRHVDQYAQAFEALGLRVERRGRDFRTFPLLSAVKASKAA
jgi:ubiquinone/menaquinone biosynthesis C-methylase UbiE